MNFVKEKFELIRGKWLSQTQKGKWSVLHKVGDTSLRILGMTIFKENKITFSSYFCGILLGVYAILVSYTIIIYNIENDLKESLKCLCVSGVVVSVKS